MRWYQKVEFFTVAPVLAALLVAGPVAAQNPPFFFAEEPTSPRAAAMGSAGAALDNGGFGCYNPASVALVPRPYTSVEYGQQAGGLDKSLIETAWMFRSWFAGASLLLHTTDFQTATEQGPGNMSTDQAYGATFCGGFSSGRFSSGHAVMVLNERIGDYSMRAVTYSTGAVYQILPGHLTAGASMYHWLRFDTLPKHLSRLPAAWYRSAIGLPRSARAGLCWRDTLPWQIPYAVVCDLVYRDLSVQYPVVNEQGSGDTANPFIIPVGVEAWVLPNLAVRLGKRFNHPEEIADFGVGLRWSTLTFDFDYSPTRPPGDGASSEAKWLLGLTYSLRAAPAAAAVPPAKREAGQNGAAPVPVPALPNVKEPAAADTSGVLPPLDEPQPKDSAGESSHSIPVPSDSLK